MHENEAGAVLMNQLATWRVYRPPRGFVGGPRQLEGRLLSEKPTVFQVRRVDFDDKQPVFRPIAHAWRVEVAHSTAGPVPTVSEEF